MSPEFLLFRVSMQGCNWQMCGAILVCFGGVLGMCSEVSWEFLFEIQKAYKTVVKLTKAYQSSSFLLEEL